MCGQSVAAIPSVWLVGVSMMRYETMIMMMRNRLTDRPEVINHMLIVRNKSPPFYWTATTFVGWVISSYREFNCFLHMVRTCSLYYEDICRGGREVSN